MLTTDTWVFSLLAICVGVATSMLALMFKYLLVIRDEEAARRERHREYANAQMVRAIADGDLVIRRAIGGTVTSTQEATTAILRLVGDEAARAALRAPGHAQHQAVTRIWPQASGARQAMQMLVAEGAVDPQIGPVDSPRCARPTPAGALCPYILGHAGPCYQTYGRQAADPTLTLSAHEGGTGHGWSATRQLLRPPSILLEPEVTGHGIAATYKHW